MRLGTPPKCSNAALCPSQTTSVVSRSYTWTKYASEYGSAITKYGRITNWPASFTSAWPKSTWASPGACSSGT